MDSSIAIDHRRSDYLFLKLLLLTLKTAIICFTNTIICFFFPQAYETDNKQNYPSENVKQSHLVRHQKALIDCKDANNNTPLSEAAGGGHADTITLLLQRGVAINSRGRYNRTPLWRAAFGGHLQAVQVSAVICLILATFIYSYIHRWMDVAI